jgi:ABC-2 type transport system permease protein
MPPGLIAAFRAELERALVAERVAALVRPLVENDPTGEDTLARVATVGPLLEMSYHRLARAELTSVQQSVPAWLVFAMFFVVIPLSTIFIAEKQHGTLPRLRTLRVSTTVLLVGKVVPFYLINLVQTTVMLLVGRYLVPLTGGDVLHLDCDWFALWVMASAVSLAAIGFALALATIARTTEQATTFGGVANILFGALGGVMVPKLVMPSAMQQATLFSPMAWGLNGFVDVFVRGAHVADLGAPVAVLMGMAVCGYAVAWWRLKAEG